MGLLALDHVNLRTAQLARMVDFYTRVLGLVEGPRPPFCFPGAWLYCGDQAVVHLIGTDAPPATYRPDQQLEHFAFSAEDMAGLIETLEADGVPYRRADLPDGSAIQINLHDPDGNHLHIDFPGPEA
jgi:catechol 2,3-dioxygenase-like lactoylglutathione lyase family enzyme